LDRRPYSATPLMSQKITSWNGETVGSGSVVNEVQFAYNDFQQISHDYQAHGSTVNISTTPKVQYGYASGSANTIRPTSITYPNGRVITYDYGTASGMNDALSRVGSILDDDAGATHLADYSYLGLGPARGLLPTVTSPFTPGAIEVDYTEPDIRYTLVGTAGGTDPDTGDIYRGYDRFGRVKDCYWYNYGASTDVDRIKYGYDRNGNRAYRENTVATAAGAYFDEKYLHDLIDRLKSMERGSLNSQHSTINNLQFAQHWGLDATGNWRSFLEDSDGNGTWDLDQTRTANKVNEIADTTETAAPSWVTPVYNRAGNMTTIPKPADPTQSFTATYDAWNRLVRIEEGANKVGEYEFDGAKRRTVKKTYVSGELDETRHFYFTYPSTWQVVEERVGTSMNANRQFAWGLRYADDLLRRDRDVAGDGALDERLYGVLDANSSLMAIVDSAGVVQERYSYDPYGVPTALTEGYVFRGGSTYGWENRFAGYQWDSESRFYLVRNRSIVPSLGVWIERDPIGYSVGVNLYQAGFVPDQIDPTGVAGCVPDLSNYFAPGGTIFGEVNIPIVGTPFGIYFRGQFTITSGKCCCPGGQPGQYTAGTGTFEVGVYAGYRKPGGFHFGSPVIRDGTSCPAAERRYSGGVVFRVIAGPIIGTCRFEAPDMYPPACSVGIRWTNFMSTASLSISGGGFFSIHNTTNTCPGGAGGAGGGGGREL